MINDIIPIEIRRIHKHREHIREGVIKTLHKAITLGMVSCCDEMISYNAAK
jgi:hypothetical protein